MIKLPKKNMRLFYNFLFLSIIVLLTIGLIYLTIQKNAIFKTSDDLSDVSDVSDVSDAKKDEMFNELMSSFQDIFPDMNRNSGGAQFFKHIYDKNLSKVDFDIYNTFYCGVSGSPIDPKRSKVFDYVKVKDISGNAVYGKYYRCCWPCICDITRWPHVMVEKFTASLKDGDFDIDVLTIKDPCNPKRDNNIPSEVTSFNCVGNETSNAVFTNSGRIIFAVLHDVTDTKPDGVDDSIKQCIDRNNTDPNDLQGGMGDIFVKMAMVGN